MRCCCPGRQLPAAASAQSQLGAGRLTVWARFRLGHAPLAWRMPGQSRPEAVQFNQQEPTLEPVSSSLERLVRVSEYSRASLRRWPPASCQLATLRGSERVSASCNIKMMDLNSTACSRGQPKGQWAESVRSDKTTKCWGVKCRRRLQTDNKSIGIPIITQMANLLIPLLFLYHLQPCQSQLTKATTTTTAPSLLLGKTVNKVKQTSGSIQISVPEPSQLFLPPVSGDRAQFVEIFKSKGDDDEEEAGGFIMQSPSTPPADKQQPEDSTAPSSDPGADLTTTTTTADQQQVATTSAEELTTGSSQVKVGGEEDGRIAINASRQQFQTHDQLLQRSTKDEPISLPATGQGQSLSQDQSQGKQQGESFEGWQFPSLRSILSGLAHATSFLSGKFSGRSLLVGANLIECQWSSRRATGSCQVIVTPGLSGTLKRVVAGGDLIRPEPGRGVNLGLGAGSGLACGLLSRGKAQSVSSPNGLQRGL